MSKVNTKYEAFLVIDNSIGEEAVRATIEKFTNLIAANGTIENVDEWGVRKFAYPINDMTEGFYILFNFTSVPSFPAELERNCNITEEILRSLVISKE